MGYALPARPRFFCPVKLYCAGYAILQVLLGFCRNQLPPNIKNEDIIMSLNKRIIISLLIIALIIPTAYLLENYDREHSVNSGHLIKMTENNRPVAYMGADVIKSLAAQEFPDDQAVKGPTLLYVMGAAGIGEFNNVEIKGLGDTSFKVARKEIDNNYILYLTIDGTVNLTPKGNVQKPIVENVSEINKIN